MGRDRLTPGEQAARDRAIAEGRVRQVPARQTRQPKEAKRAPEGDARIASKAPPPRAVPAEMSVRDALEWAFATECAYFDVDEIGAVAGGQRSGIGLEFVLIQRAMVGQVDTSPGRSFPADDAELIASVVRSALPLSEAVWVADMARARLAPDGLIRAKPRLVPVEWHRNRHGWTGKRADARELGVEGWQPQQRLNRKGVIVREAVFYTPCTWEVTGQQIARARRRWLDWWGHLLTLQVAIRAAGPRWFAITDEMPPMTPWRKGD